MHIHVRTRSPMVLDEDEDRSARSSEREGVIEIDQYFVCISIYLNTYIYIIYMYTNAHTCTNRISRMS